jgi:multiple antibiotic resistance protein
MDSFFLAFIPLFVAIDVFGVLPVFIGITEGLAEAQRRSLVLQATLTAFAVSTLFLVTGRLPLLFPWHHSR